MDLQSLLNGFRARAPWRSVGSPFLRELGFHLGRSFEGSVADIILSGATDKQISALHTGLVEHAVVGEKSVRVVKVGQSDMAKLAVWAKNKRASKNVLTDAFPSIAKADDIRANADGSLHYVDSVQFETGTAAIFTSVRSYLDKVVLGMDSLRPSVAERYEKIVGQKRHFVQTFDAIFIPAKGRFVYLLADYPEVAPTNFPVNSQSALEVALRRNVEEYEILSLWPAIEGLYLAKDGKFIEHGFQTDGDSVKSHKSRRGSKDLRQDEFFKAGRAKIEGDGQDLVSYRVATRWSIKQSEKLTTTPEIMLPGTLRQWTMGHPLEEAILRNCLNMRDLNFVMSKVTQHL